MEIENMSREDIEKYLASMRSSPNTTGVPASATGVHDPSKLDFGKVFSNKSNKWQSYIDKNVTDPAAKEDMKNQIQALLSAKPSMSPAELKFRLRAIEANIRRKYPNGVSKNFDVSGSMTDKRMAKMLLKPAEKLTEKPAEKPNAIDNATQVANTNKGVANAKVGDWIIRSNGQKYVLKQSDIDWAKKSAPTKTEPTKTEPTKTEPTKTEPTKTEPTKTEPTKERLTGMSNKVTTLTGGRITPQTVTAYTPKKDGLMGKSSKQPTKREQPSKVSEAVVTENRQ